MDNIRAHTPVSDRFIDDRLIFFVRFKYHIIFGTPLPWTLLPTEIQRKKSQQKTEDEADVKVKKKKNI